MALKGLRPFESFRIVDFLRGKILAVLEVEELRERTDDGKPGAVIGTKVTVVVLEDKTDYPAKDGKPISNRYAQLTIKVKKIGLTIPVDTVIELVNPTATVWGEYRNNLSITADDVRPVNASAGKGQQ